MQIDGDRIKRGRGENSSSNRAAFVAS